MTEHFTSEEAVALASTIGRLHRIFERQHTMTTNLLSVIDQLVGALEDAATSLETISRLAGKTHYVGNGGERVETYMGHHDQVRGYAISRASAARAALSRAQAAPAVGVPDAAFKLGRNAGLEEAEQFFQDNDTNLFWGSQAAGYTESLKDNTP